MIVMTDTLGDPLNLAIAKKYFYEHGKAKYLFAIMCSLLSDGYPGPGLLD